MGQSARPTTASKRLSRPRLSSSCLAFCTCFLRLLMFPLSRPCRLLAGARVVQVLAGIWTYWTSLDDCVVAFDGMRESEEVMVAEAKVKQRPVSA